MTFGIPARVTETFSVRCELRSRELNCTNSAKPNESVAVKAKWDVAVRGKGHQVVVDGSTSGAHVIRVDGRVTARALDPDETQRAFFVDGVAYSLRRNAAGVFELVPIGSGPAHVRSAKADTISVDTEDDRRNVFSRWLRALARSLFSSSDRG
jgi:hypothetical protein